MCNSADCGCVLFVCFSGLQGLTRNPQWFITIHNQHFRFDCLLMFIMSVGLSVWDGCRFFRRWWNSHTQGWMLAWCSQSHRCSKFCWIFVEPTKGQFGTISFHLISVSTFAATCSAFRICSRAVLLHTHVMLYSCVIAFYWRMQCSIIRSFRRKSSIQYPIFSSRFWRWTKTSLHRLCLLLCLFLNDALLLGQWSLAWSHGVSGRSVFALGLWLWRTRSYKRDMIDMIDMRIHALNRLSDMFFRFWNQKEAPTMSLPQHFGIYFAKQLCVDLSYTFLVKLRFLFRALYTIKWFMLLIVWQFSCLSINWIVCLLQQLVRSWGKVRTVDMSNLTDTQNLKHVKTKKMRMLDRVVDGIWGLEFHMQIHINTRNRWNILLLLLVQDHVSVAFDCWARCKVLERGIVAIRKICLNKSTKTERGGS